MTLKEKSESIGARILSSSNLPFALRAAQMSVLVPEIVALLIDLSEAVETHEQTILQLRCDIDNLQERVNDA